MNNMFKKIIENLEDFGKYKGVLKVTEDNCDNYISVSDAKRIVREYEDKFVSRAAYEQVMWERDVAIEQLKELGYGFGEKVRTK